MMLWSNKKRRGDSAVSAQRPHLLSFLCSLYLSTSLPLSAFCFFIALFIYWGRTLQFLPAYQWAYLPPVWHKHLSEECWCAVSKKKPPKKLTGEHKIKKRINASYFCWSYLVNKFLLTHLGPVLSLRSTIFQNCQWSTQWEQVGRWSLESPSAPNTHTFYKHLHSGRVYYRNVVCE